MPDGRQPPPMQPLRERLAAQQTRQDEPLVCDTCGSTFFFHIHVHQYSKPTGYMSTELRTITITPIPVRVCLCGNIVPPAGSSAIGSPSERSAFQASVELVREFTAKADPNQLVKSLASIKELESLRADLLAMRIRIDALQSAAAAQVVETPEISDEKLDELVRAPQIASNPTGKKKQNHKPAKE